MHRTNKSGRLARIRARGLGVRESGLSKMRLANHFKDINSRKCFNQFCAAQAQYKFNLTHKLLAQPKGLPFHVVRCVIGASLCDYSNNGAPWERSVHCTVKHGKALLAENRTRAGQAQDIVHKGRAERRTKKGQRNGNV